MSAPSYQSSLPEFDYWLAADWILSANTPPMPDGFIHMVGGRVKAVGTLNDLAPSQAAQLRQKFLGNQPTWLTPGLVNTHTHIDLSFSHGPIPLDFPTETMADWLAKVVACTRQSSESIQQRCHHGVDLLLASGTTCVNDVTQHTEAAEWVGQRGLRATISLEYFHPGWQALTLAPAMDTFHRLQYVASTFSQLQVGLSPHSPYNVSPKAWVAMLDACKPTLVHAHVGESTDELGWLHQQPNGIDTLHQQILGKTFTPQPLIGGKVDQPASPLAYLVGHNCLPKQLPTVLAHGIHFDDGDWAWLVANPHVGVSHCPTSNQWLHQATLASHVPRQCLSLGTDSLLSSPHLDVRAEGRWAIANHHWPADEVFTMLTLHGATQLGLDDVIGTVTPGKAADIVLWQGEPSLPTIASPKEAIQHWFSTLVSASQVWIDGRLTPMSNQPQPLTE